MLEQAIVEIRKELRWMRGVGYYLAGVLTVDLGLGVFG